MNLLPVLEFFVDVDRETIKRISVHPLDDGRFLLKIRLQFDKGWETQEQQVEVRDKNALARRLISEDVPEHVVYDDLQMEAPPSKSILTALAVSVAIWLVLGLVILWLLGWL